MGLKQKMFVKSEFVYFLPHLLLCFFKQLSCLTQSLTFSAFKGILGWSWELGALPTGSEEDPHRHPPLLQGAGQLQASLQAQIPPFRRKVAEALCLEPGQHSQVLAGTGRTSQHLLIPESGWYRAGLYQEGKKRGSFLSPPAKALLHVNVEGLRWSEEGLRFI